MSDFTGYEDYDRKLTVSEGIEHERENRPEDKKKVEGYEPLKGEAPYYEVMGIRNSFDNVAVGKDKYGQMLISVTTNKRPGRATLDSNQKRLKGAQRKKKIDTYGDFYTNLASGRDGAFGFRADKNISDIRMYQEFRRLAQKRVSAKQREAAPFLRLDDDMAALREMQAYKGAGEEDLAQRQVLEKRVQKETESRNRFIARLRKARRKSYETEKKQEEEKSFLRKVLDALDTGAPDTEESTPPAPEMPGTQTDPAEEEK